MSVSYYLIGWYHYLLYWLFLGGAHTIEWRNSALVPLGSIFLFRHPKQHSVAIYKVSYLYQLPPVPLGYYSCNIFPYHCFDSSFKINSLPLHSKPCTVVIFLSHTFTALPKATLFALGIYCGFFWCSYIYCIGSVLYRQYVLLSSVTSVYYIYVLILAFLLCICLNIVFISNAPIMIGIVSVTSIHTRVTFISRSLYFECSSVLL